MEKMFRREFFQQGVARRTRWGEIFFSRGIRAISLLAIFRIMDEFWIAGIAQQFKWKRRS